MISFQELAFLELFAGSSTRPKGRYTKVETKRPESVYLCDHVSPIIDQFSISF